MNIFVIFCVIFLSFTETWALRTRYDNYKVYRLIPKTLEEIQHLRELEKSDPNLKFWKISTDKHRPSDIMVPPHRDVHFQEYLVQKQIKHGLMIENIQSLIDGSKPNREQYAEFGWNDYYNLTELYNWMNDIAVEFPDNVKIVIAGKSYEDRDIKGIKLSYKEGNKAVFIEGGIHAREWIAPAVTTYILNELLRSNDADIREIAETYDWYFFPSVNPDGFEYTHTTDRLWRMTRQPHGPCIGADPNRNWGFHWNEGGTSNNSCDETYAGPYAFSEPEMKSLSEYIAGIHKDLIAYLSIHSYSQLLLIPYGFENTHVENYEECMEIGTEALKSLAKRYGTQYDLGNMAETIYVASGVSPDWVKGNFHIPITYTYELRDTGKHGFILPPEQIIPTAEETLDSIVTMMLEAKSRGYT